METPWRQVKNKTDGRSRGSQREVEGQVPDARVGKAKVECPHTGIAKSQVGPQCAPAWQQSQDQASNSFSLKGDLKKSRVRHLALLPDSPVLVPNGFPGSLAEVWISPSVAHLLPKKRVSAWSPSVVTLTLTHSPHGSAYRFVFFLLGPRAKVKAYHEIGRAVATLLTDDVSLGVGWNWRWAIYGIAAAAARFFDRTTVSKPRKIAGNEYLERNFLIVKEGIVFRI